MTLPTSGPISMVQVRAEAGVGGAISLDQAEVRTLAAVASGVISMSDLRGKTGPGAAGTMVVTATGAESIGQATGTVFTAYASPSVTVTGETAPLSHLWTIATQSGGGFVLENANLAECLVSHLIGKYGYIGSCTMSCTVSDGAGHTDTKTGIPVEFDYQQPFAVD
jgi:hypothetical protein